MPGVHQQEQQAVYDLDDSPGSVIVRSLAIIGAALVLMGAALCLPIGAYADGWPVSIVGNDTIVIQRDPGEMPPHSSQVFVIWKRDTAPSQTQYANGTWDTTGAAQAFTSKIATLSMDSTDMQVQYKLPSESYTGIWYLVEGAGQDQLVAAPALEVSLVGTPAVSVSGVSTVSVAGTVPVSMATSASIAGTLPVTLTDASLPLSVSAMMAMGAVLGGAAIVRAVR